MTVRVPSFNTKETMGAMQYFHLQRKFLHIYIYSPLQIHAHYMYICNSNHVIVHIITCTILHVHVIICNTCTCNKNVMYTCDINVMYMC